ncbi:MbtH family NRPS accessory protein [Streptomyces sp. CB01881]|uniref:MbtH family NRPS accessory protein n=1 Tax=Streptomyces sp. CB01881 TaxID=2078691 RepID=UPI000CDCDFED|nr:MbtH family NRPS accessory protein [Streptomyces sp. CB01881]AUY48465.1 MbtH family protein [Streptomyces sp. CB01881]TYC76954.1 MbtH family protein [Streptomyces sp. CB01881]
MSSPFEDRGDEASHVLLVNAAGEHSLWPVFAELPAGWRQVLPAASHRACLAAAEHAAAASTPGTTTRGVSR